MAQYEYEFEEELTPLHEYEFESEADPFFGRIKRGLRSLARRALPMLKRLAPIAARIVAGAIPGVGAIAGPLAGKLAGALTQEQQQELEATLHEACSVAMPGENGCPQYGTSRELPLCEMVALPALLIAIAIRV